MAIYCHFCYVLHFSVWWRLFIWPDANLPSCPMGKSLLPSPPPSVIKSLGFEALERVRVESLLAEQGFLSSRFPRRNRLSGITLSGSLLYAFCCDFLYPPLYVCNINHTILEWATWLKKKIIECWSYLHYHRMYNWNLCANKTNGKWIPFVCEQWLKDTPHQTVPLDR